MGRHTPTPIKLPPGFVRKEGPRAAAGRYIDGDKVRFVRGLPEKIGGWERSTLQPVDGLIRGVHNWNDLAARSYTAIGTTSHLYYTSGVATPINITPVGANTALTNAFSTTSGSSAVRLTYPSHNLLVGRGILISGAGTVGGIAMNGDYVVAAIIDANTISFTAAASATSTVSGTGSCSVALEILPGPEDPSEGLGYGVGGYGRGFYGTPRAASPFTSEPRYWSLDNFGKFLLAAPFEGQLYAFDPTALPVARPARVAPSEAPGAMRGMFVTEERVVVAYGASPDAGTTTDSMLLWWCHQGDYTKWNIADPLLTAGQRRINRGKRIIGGTPIANAVSLIWTDVAVFMFQFTGGRFVYDLRQVGTDCGLFGPHAFTLAGPMAFWVGPGGFYMYAGSAQPIPNSDNIREWVFGRLRPFYEVKTVAFYNSRFREVWFLFVPTGERNNAFYAAYSMEAQEWVTGTLSRTAAARARSESGSANPILASTDGYLYQHERGLNDNGAAIDAWIQSGVFDAGNGASDMDVEGFMPDFERHVGDLNLRVSARDRSATPTIDQQDVMVAPGVGVVDLRLAGRLIDFRLRCNTLGGDFRMGVPLFETKTSGGRR